MDGKRVEKRNPEDGSKVKLEGSMNKNEEASMMKNEGGNIMKNEGGNIMKNEGGYIMKNEGGMDRKDEGGIDRKGERMMRGERRKEITKNGSPVHSQKVNFYI